MAKINLTGTYEEDIETIKSMGSGTYIDADGIEWTREELHLCYTSGVPEAFIGEYAEVREG